MAGTASGAAASFAARRAQDTHRHQARSHEGEAARQFTVAAVDSERKGTRCRAAIAVLYPPRSVALRDGVPWVGNVSALVARGRRRAATSAVRGTTLRYAKPLQDALGWMAEHWARQRSGRPFSLKEVAEHDGALLFAYCESIAESRPRPSRAVATVCSAVDGLLERNLLLPVARKQPDFVALRKALRLRDSAAADSTMNLRPEAAKKIVREWGFAVSALTRPGRKRRRLSVYRYRRWVALLCGLGVAVLGRWDDLSWLQVNSVFFAREGALRCFSVCLTHRKNVQLNTPEWVTVVEDPVDRHCVYRLVVAMFEEEFGLVVDTEAFSWEPPQDFRRRFLFPQFAVQHCWKRELYNPDMVWFAGRGKYFQFLTQFKNALREVLGFDKATVRQYGLSSLRSGGDTWLEALGVSKESRMLVGHWATGAVEARYVRLSALDHARKRRRWKCVI